MLIFDKYYCIFIEVGVLLWYLNLYLVIDEGISCIISGLDLKKSDVVVFGKVLKSSNIVCIYIKICY